MEETDSRNLIDDLYETYNSRRQAQPLESERALAPYLEAISESFDEALSAYLSDSQRNAYRAGFAAAMQLAADCYAENKEIIRHA